MIAQAWALLRTASHVWSLDSLDFKPFSSASVPPARLGSPGSLSTSLFTRGTTVDSHVSSRFITFHFDGSSQFAFTELSLCFRIRVIFVELLRCRVLLSRREVTYVYIRYYMSKSCRRFWALLICTWLRLRYSFGHFDARLVPVRHFLSIEQN